jgi:TetR/AcrR family transcriptional regulator
MNESPELFLLLPATAEDNLPQLLNDLLEQGKQNQQVAPEITGEDLMLNIYALCAMPYLAAPYIRAKENRNEVAMTTFLRARRAKNLTFILKGIRV